MTNEERAILEYFTNIFSFMEITDDTTPTIRWIEGQAIYFIVLSGERLIFTAQSSEWEMVVQVVAFLFDPDCLAKIELAIRKY